MKAMNRPGTRLGTHCTRQAKPWMGALMGCCSLLGFAQSPTHTHKAATRLHPASPAIRATAEKTPRSMPSAVVPQLIGGNTAASRNELNRLEHMGAPRTSHVATRNRSGTARGSAYAANVSRVQPQNSPINFSYQVPGKRPSTAANSAGHPR